MNLIEVLEKAAEEIKDKTPEEQEAILARMRELLPSEQLAETLKQSLAAKVHQYGFTLEGYKAFYELVHGIQPPDHVIEEVDRIINNEGGIIVFAWRGSWKTVSISVTLLALFIGLYPELTNLIVCASEDFAVRVTDSVTNIIQYHPAWKRVFPHVVPDKGQWSQNGYSVVDTRMTREEWQTKKSSSIDPTLVGGGYDSQNINGKHPTGFLICDDLHNEKNSISESMKQSVINQVLRVILKTAVVKDDKLITRIVFVGTPWAEDDVSQVLKNSGEYEFLAIPAAVRAMEGEEGAVYCDGKSKDGTVYQDVMGWWKFRFSGYGLRSFVYDRATMGMKNFWQLIMLDIIKANTSRMIYYGYSAKDVNLNWRGGAGLDPTNNDETTDSKSSHMAIGVVLRLPTGGGVVTGEVLKQCSLQETEDSLLMTQSKYPNLQPTAIEFVAGGKVVFQALQKNPKIRVIKSGLKDVTDGEIRNKRERMRVMHKWFENGTIRISDEDTPFLNALRRLWDKFNDLDPRHSPEFDAGDAVYHALNNMPDLLYIQPYDEFPEPQRKVEKGNPFKGLSEYSWIKRP